MDTDPVYVVVIHAGCFLCCCSDAGSEAVELAYNISATAFNIGNDTDSDGVADDFGDADTVTNHSVPIPESMYNTWTDKDATAFIPYYFATYDGSTETIHCTIPNVTPSTLGYVYARQRESMWKIYTLRSGWANYLQSYDYQNPANTVCCYLIIRKKIKKQK